ncbi:BsuPI-related putative proteinase inhibitor (plasmid) [Deinococcus sp. KNUC1210]|uniref:BsuPI-related putative proteinase inhibitor n=1 Tax=Deinococcus sp. KNUC1210 TaxID=2917691 RepID=UPI001EF0B811|nr:BsuPI-related putative proteinase inhibitor [Deinococcus sp. KNUC1210]ULH13926.1 BsuPI-related putative proteinase inhibitor [Deinococcus sp. KNUC1210]
MLNIRQITGAALKILVYFLKIISVSVFICYSALASQEIISMPNTNIAPSVEDQNVGNFPIRFNLITLASYIVGQSIIFKLFIKNISQSDLTISVARNVPDYDVIVLDSQGTLVWRCKDDSEIVRLGMDEDQTIAGGQVWEFRCTWKQNNQNAGAISPGLYIAKASLLVNESNIFSVVRQFNIK